MTGPTVAGLGADNLTVPVDALGRLQPFNSGANGTINGLPDFQLPDDPGSLIFKEYRAGVVQVALAGLQNIVGIRSRLPAPCRAVLDDLTVWPLRVVTGRAGEPLGVLMKLIPDQFWEEISLPSGNRERIPREVQHLIFEPAMARRHSVDVPDDGDLVSRLRICERLAYIVSLLHGAALIFGDLSARNVLYTLRPHPSVLLVDCDAARVLGSAPVNKQQDTPDWDPPETAQARQHRAPTNQSMRTDRYKLALFILRCLTPGRGSSTNRDWSVARGVLDPHGQQLLRAALEGPPADRPLARDWVLYLRSSLGLRPMPLLRVASGAPVAMPAPAAHLGQAGWRRDVGGNWVPA